MIIYRQDAIDAAIEAADDWDGGCSKERDRFIRDALEELPSAQPEQRWIPVTDHLPDEDIPVLVTDDAGGMATVGIDSCGRYEDTGERFWYTSQNVTAWMHTIEPYGGEQE